MPQNHELMTQLRHEKVARIAQDIPPVEVNGPASGELLVIGWGSTYGAIGSAVDVARGLGHTLSQVHLRHLNPFPSNLGDVLARFDKILVPELNRGQLSRLLRAEYLVPAEVLSKVQGQPFKVEEIVARIEEMLA
jgi:2-oxoglutarate ferredoxin oxidoreductase subunit alpha